jgi:pantoate--beta-alanine ligase
MKLLKRVSEVKAWRQLSNSLGFVPTMGALHDGHLSLVEKSKSQNEQTLASIFVNPTQFNDPKDLQNYPRDIEADCALLNKAGVDAVFLPEADEIYQDKYRYRISESEFSKILCGAFRPGHFDGVLTVVMKLLNIVQPHRCYMGEKDYQQLQLVKDMAATFFMSTDIVPCPTLREPDGLAMSSRNRLLSADQRERAPRLYQALRRSDPIPTVVQDLETFGFKVEYLEEHFGRRFVAAKLGHVRLIDNVEI